MTSRTPASATESLQPETEVDPTLDGRGPRDVAAVESRTERAAHKNAHAHPRRITSLDSVRGVLLVVNVAAISVLAPIPDQLVHAQWFGITFFDVIFPLFVTFSGVGLAFAYRNVVGWRRTFRRSSVLLLVGLVYNMIITSTFDIRELRVTGPLQIYAVLVLVIGVLHLKLRTPRMWAMATVGIAAVHAFVFAAWQAGCPGGELLRSCNPSRGIDPSLFGSAHVYAQGIRGHDPEGLVATLGALVTIIVGTTAGHVALRYRGTSRAPAKLLMWSVPVAAMALATLTFLPAMKRLWTSPFALGIAALGVVLFAVGIVIMDLPGPRWWELVRDPLSWPLVALGRNSLLVYFGSHLVMFVLIRNGGETSWAERLSGWVDVAGHERITFMLFMVALWVAVTGVLHRRKIYLRP